MIVEAEMILIKNARVMDPESGFDQVTDILLDGKRIRQIGKVDDVSGIEQVIDASGMIAAPGLIDVHVHFRDPGFTYKEDLQTGSAAAAAGGFTTVVCMANTKPVVDSVDIYKEIEDKLQDRFMTKVKINDKKGKGDISISYYSEDELTRIIEILENL